MRDGDLNDLYEDAPCGYVSLTPDARIDRLNGTLAGWLGQSAEALVGQSFHALLSFGGRIAYETHLAPMLRLRGRVDEIALDLLDAGGARVPVIANAREKRDDEGDHLFTRITMFKAVERRKFERSLIDARSEADARAEAEHETSLLREQFIAVLSHDLRNPVAALDAGIRLLGGRETLSERGQFLIREMGASLSRASTLIENVLDFARGRLGGGLTLMRDAREPLVPVLEQVVSEIRAIAPEREIVTKMQIGQPVDCDRPRIAQLASNLIANAVTHGDPNTPIVVKAYVEDESFIFSVSNGGDPIPLTSRAQLFQPFFRGGVRQRQQGLGLGLFIVNEIAKAHGGTMEVSSTVEETRFTFSMPIHPAVQ
ncbi:MAG: PAS domain-containing sensor histidine kinase [Sphingobium sp.]|uniref:PAS domain-containing sensor histidine kinase n=1 Tax=Sphingobium sp. TaxID=1912891 RepID=UPI0029B698DB|nr:PAS domain-containing sensor histidine kinase [Sphingobium sp.]MDX3911731.1 PAS domain-containing sensor histidine kinase [Sphingobium sp.]